MTANNTFRSMLANYLTIDQSINQSTTIGYFHYSTSLTATSRDPRRL